MLVRTTARSAVHIPVFLLAISAVCLFGAIAMLQDEVGAESIGMSVFALLVVGLTLGSLHTITARDSVIQRRSLYGRCTMDLDRLALGLRVRHSKGHRYYTIYAYDGDEELDLAEASTQRGADRLRARLDALLFDGGEPRPGSAAARDELARREAKYRSDMAEAQRLAGAVSSRRPLLLVVSAVLLVLIVTMAVVTATAG